MMPATRRRRIVRRAEIMRLPGAVERQREFDKLDQQIRSRTLITWQGMVTGIMGLKGTVSRDVGPSGVATRQPGR